MSAPPVIGSTLRSRLREGDVVVRSVGPAASTGFSPIPPDVVELVAAETGKWRWDCGTGDATERRYNLPSDARSLADIGLTDPHAVDDWERALGHIGAALGRLHQSTPHASWSRAPQGLDRLSAFLHGTGLSGRAVQLRRGFIDALPAGFLLELQDDVLRAGHPVRGVRSHGWAGLGRWFVLSDRTAIGLIGEDLGVAAAEHDLAAVLAQVIELRFFRPALTGFITLADARAALLAGYPLPVDQPWLDREVRLAVTRHLADVCVHASCPDEEPARWAELIHGLEVN